MRGHHDEVHPSCRRRRCPGGPCLRRRPGAGEATFKKCKACHSIIGADGTEIQKGGKTGPNLYGVIGRAVASDPDFSYGDSICRPGRHRRGLG
jgi:cytochrome c